MIKPLSAFISVFSAVFSTIFSTIFSTVFPAIFSRVFSTIFSTTIFSTVFSAIFLAVFLVNTVAFAKLGMPEAGNQYANRVDSLYYFLLVVSLISCVLVIGGMIYFVVRYKRQSDFDQTPYISHNNTLEFLWSFIPFIIFMIVFVWGFVLFREAQTAPNNSFEVHVYGRQWAWEFAYKSGKATTNEIVVPVGRPVKLIMTSKDVLHSFFIPALRIKQDVIPGRYTTLWFEAEKIGDYQVFCTEYCGAKHSGMLATLKVLSLEAFEEWLADDPMKEYDGLPLAVRGEKVAQKKACIACHDFKSEENGPLAPGLKNLIGKKRESSDGASWIADEDYIRESLKYPQKKVVAAYAGKAAMPVIPLNEEEITWLIEYIKSNKE